MEFMLDTDTCSYFIKDQPQIVAKLQKERGNFCISSIVYCELLEGLLASKGTKFEAAYSQFLRIVEVMPFTKSDAIAAADIEVSLAKSGMRISDYDALIAGHAANSGLTLVTNNTRHYSRIRGLFVENLAS